MTLRWYHKRLSRATYQLDQIRSNLQQSKFCKPIIRHWACLSPKCFANPITVTPIWKREAANGEYPIRGFYMIFSEKFVFKFPFSHKRFQMGMKMCSYQLYKLQWKSLKNPFSVCKWEIAPFPLQRILGRIDSCGS